MQRSEASSPSPVARYSTRHSPAMSLSVKPGAAMVKPPAGRLRGRTAVTTPPFTTIERTSSPSVWGRVANSVEPSARMLHPVPMVSVIRAPAAVRNEVPSA